MLAEPFDVGDGFLTVAFVLSRRRRRRVHAVREPGRGGLVLSSGNGSAKIRVEGATKVYETKTGPVHALEDVSVDVRDGELVCILGPSGCGKTTLLWAMSGLARADPRPGPARRHGRRRAAPARDRDDLPGGEPAAVAQPAPEPRVPVRDQAAQAGRGADREAARRRPASPASRRPTRASSRAACSSGPRSCARSRRTRRCS